jgi:diguanylate cyclase (GGDEF)-like protein/PAS domain S-box-containing protein
MPSNTPYNVQMSIDDFPDNVVIYRYVDDDFIFIDLNKNAEVTEDISKEELIGKKLTERFPTVKEFGLYDLLVKAQEEGTAQELDMSLYEDRRISGWRHNSIRKLPNGDLIVVYKDVSDYKLLELEIQRNKKALDEAQKIARVGDWKWDMITNEVTWSDEVYRIFGEHPQSFIPSFEGFMSFLNDEDKSSLHEVITLSIQNDEPYNIEHHVIRRDGQFCYVNGSGHTQYNEKKEPVAMIGKVLDITERKKELLQLQKTEAQLKLLGQAIEQTDEMIRITDKNGLITYVNEALVAHTGYRRIELIGQNMSIFKSDQQDPDFYKELWETISSGKTYRGIMINRKKDKTIYYEEQTITPIFDDTKHIQHYVSTSQDITERIALEEQLKELATIDSLTEISNRRKITEEIESEIVRAKRYDVPFAIAMFDLDYFKEVNDTYGHDIGDYVLKKISRLISQYVREGDSFGRWGGEEFMLIFPNLSQEKAMLTADKLRELVANCSFNKVPEVTISIGVCTYTKGETIKTLLKRVDDALYAAKETGRNRVVFK